MAQQTYVLRSDGVTTVVALKLTGDAQNLTDFSTWAVSNGGASVALGKDQLTLTPGPATILPGHWAVFSAGVYSDMNPDTFAATYDPQGSPAAEATGVQGAIAGPGDTTSAG